MTVSEAAAQRVVGFLQRSFQPPVGQGDELARNVLARDHASITRPLSDPAAGAHGKRGPSPPADLQEFGKTLARL